MERLSKLVRSLRTARASDLPADATDASYVLMPLVMQNQYRAITELLTNSIFDVSHKFGKAKRSLLHIAANVGAFETLTIFIKKGAALDCQDRSGITPLQLAARNGHARCIEKLIEAGADVDLQNNEGMTPIHWLASNGRTEILEEFLPHVKNINITDHQGQTALHVACLNGHHQTIRKLLQNNASVNVRDLNGCTPLFSACRHGHSLPVKMLLENGAQLISDNENVSPLEVAFGNGYGDVCLSLTDYNHSLLSDIVKLSQHSSKEQALKVCSYICDTAPAFQKDVLMHLAQSAFSLGTLLLNTTERCDAAVADHFILMVDLICCLWSTPSDDRSLRMRSSSNSSIRSRIDSGGRFLRNLGSPPSSARNDDQQFDDVADTLHAMWTSVDNWFRLFQIEVKNFEQEALNETKPGVVPTCGNPIREVVQLICPSCNSMDASSPSLDIRCKRTKVPKSVRLSQPALEFNLARLMQEESVPLSRSLSGPGGFSHSPDGPTSARNEAPSVESYHQPRYQSDQLESPERLLQQQHPQTVVTDSTTNSSQIEHSSDIANSNPSHLTQAVLPQSSARHASPRALDHGVMEQPDGRQPLARANNDIQTDVGTAESLADAVVNRICAVVHGFNIASMSKPFWMERSSAELFDEFITTKESVLRMLVARKPIVIFQHFHFLLRHPLLFQNYADIIQDQPFELRRKWFYENLFKGRNGDNSNYDERNVISVDRGSVLESSCEQILRQQKGNLLRPINIQFRDEQGMGQGVAREWLDLLFKELLNPDCALFTLSADGTSFQPNKNSFVNPDHLTYFHFAGRMLGMSLYHQHLVNANFTRSFYKHLLGIPVNYADVSSIDLEYSKNLQWILDNDIDDLGLDLTFAIETDVFGETKEIELKQGGAEIVVNDANKAEYVQLASDLRMTKAIKPQLYSILEGFHGFIPHSLIAMFNECELETMLSGLSTIDVADWQTNTVYHSGYSSDSEVIQWFWEIVKSYKEKQCIRLLRFVTGSSHVPWGGFANLRGSSGLQLFSISRSNQTVDNLPTASTCFNMLQLPEYPNKDTMMTKINIALGHGSLGFEFT